MPNQYALMMYDPDGFPLFKGVSLLVSYDITDGQPYIVASSPDDDDDSASARFALAPNQPPFEDQYKPPFCTYTLANNSSLSITAEV